MKKLITLHLVILHMLVFSTQAQQPTRQSLEAKKKELSALEPSITENKNKTAENKNKIIELEAEIKKLNATIEAQRLKAEDLKNEIAVESDEVAFLESPARTIIDVTSSKTFVIDYNGNNRYVTLHGLQVDSTKDREIIKVFKKKLIKQPVYIRCVDVLCNQVYIYGSLSGQSLNAEMVKNGLALADVDAKYDVASLYAPTNTTSSPATSTSSSSSTTPGKDVEVKGYYRKDGTYVRPHTRSAPKRKP